MGAFAGQLGEYQRLRGLIAIRQTLIEHLDQFLSSDVRKASKALTHQQDGMTIVVDEKYIEEVRSEMVALIEQYEQTIKEL